MSIITEATSVGQTETMEFSWTTELKKVVDESKPIAKTDLKASVVVAGQFLKTIPEIEPYSPLIDASLVVAPASVNSSVDFSAEKLKDLIDYQTKPVTPISQSVSNLAS